MPELAALVPLGGSKPSEAAFSMLPLSQRLGVIKGVLVGVWKVSGKSKVPAAETRSCASKRTKAVGTQLLLGYAAPSAEHASRTDGRSPMTEMRVAPANEREAKR